MAARVLSLQVAREERQDDAALREAVRSAMTHGRIREAAHQDMVSLKVAAATVLRQLRVSERITAARAIAKLEAEVRGEPPDYGRADLITLADLFGVPFLPDDIEASVVAYINAKADLLVTETVVACKATGDRAPLERLQAEKLREQLEWWHLEQERMAAQLRAEQADEAHRAAIRELNLQIARQQLQPLTDPQERTEPNGMGTLR